MELIKYPSPNYGLRRDDTEIDFIIYLVFKIFVASNLAQQGQKYPIDPAARPDDGILRFNYLDSKLKRSRVVKIG